MTTLVQRTAPTTALLLLTLWGCGGAEPATLPRAASLFDGLVASSAAPRPPLLLSSHRITDADHGWELEGVDRAEVRSIWAGQQRDSTESVLGLGLMASDDVTLRRPLAPGAESCARVEADLSFWGPGKPTLRAALVDSSGAVRALSDELRIVPGRGPVTYSLDLRADGAAATAGDQLELRVAGLRGPVALVGTRLFEVDPRGLTPPHQAPAPVSLGTSSRHAVGLHPGTPLVAEVTVPVDGVLHLAVGRAPGVTGADEVMLEITAAGTTTLERSLRTPAEGWLDERIGLADLAGRKARISLAARGGSAVVGGGRIIERRPAHPVVLLSSDTHRADHLGTTATGFQLRTPQLDRLAARGVQFLLASSTTNVTNPSHAAMLTGLHPRDTRVVDNTTPLQDRAWTLAEAFQRAGYRTLAVTSAMQLQPRFSGFSQGFDLYDAPLIGMRDGDDTIDVLERWLDECEGEPLFAFVHIYEAHVPYRPTGEAVTRHLATIPAEGGPRGAPPLPAWARDYADDATGGSGQERWVPAHLYRAEVEDVDRLLGRVCRLAPLQDGFLAFVSDHGESFGARGVWWDHASLAPDNLGVPMILVGPGVQPARQERPLQNHRVGATLLSLAGVDPGGFPGASLLAREQESPRFALSAHGEAASVALGPWQLTMSLRECAADLQRPARAHGEVSLVDLREPEPRPDRLDDEFERARQMRQALIDWLADADPEGLAGSPAKLSDSARESLAALGYATDAESRVGAWWDPEGADPEWLARFR